MEQLKKYHRHGEMKKDSNITDKVEEEESVDEGEEVKEEKTVRKSEKNKKGKEEKRNPSLGQKLQVAAFASLSTTERLINGLTEGYKNIFVGPAENKVNFNKELGYKYFDKGDYETAKDYFLEYIENGKENDAEILYMIAMCHKNMDQTKEAMRYLRKAEKLNKDDPDIISELGDCLFMSEDYPEAIIFLNKASELQPDNSDIYYQLGTCYEKIEQIEEAKNFYKKAIDLEPREAVYYQALGFLYENSGSHKDAVACFKKAMDMERIQRGVKRGGGVKYRPRV